MYSAYVQSMALLYNYLFNDSRYAQPAALTFRFWSYFWGGKEKRFEYDQNSLQRSHLLANGPVGLSRRRLRAELRVSDMQSTRNSRLPHA